VRASRLVSILLLLQTRGRMTAQELADELEVSVRTIYRDVDSLGEAGVPVYGDRGPAGGYQLLDGYRTRLTGLTADEAASLFLAGVPGPAAELGLGTVLATAQLKLLAALPPELRSRAGRIQERFHLDAPGWYADAEQAEYLASVADAVWSQHAIRVHYRRWGGEVWRTLEPLGVVLKGGAWYLVARATGQVRTYRVSRILELETLGERFERPEAFDLAAYWRAWSEEFQERRFRGEVVVRLSPRGLELLNVLSDPTTARRVTASVGPPDRDGWVQAVLPVESLRHAEVNLLRLGADAEVLAPSELRARIAATACVLADLYRSSEPGLPSAAPRGDQFDGPPVRTSERVPT
jgi:predicted DNA-binding transcriptional regulator YafY